MTIPVAVVPVVLPVPPPASNAWRTMRWLAQFFETPDGTPSTARLIAIAAFVVGSVGAFLRWNLIIVGMFIVHSTAAVALRTLGQKSASSDGDGDSDGSGGNGAPSPP